MVSVPTSESILSGFPYKLASSCGTFLNGTLEGIGHWALGIGHWALGNSSRFSGSPRLPILPRACFLDLAFLRGRRGDSIPKTAFALLAKLLYWNSSPEKPMHPTKKREL